MADLFPDLVVFMSPQELSDAPIPRTFDVTLHATKPRTLVFGSEKMDDMGYSTHFCKDAKDHIHHF